jgi:exoribonuclease R
MCDWIPGTLELTSKVRYGITSRGVPIFRFIPYDKLHRPLAVSCSHSNLFHNIHAIVQPGPAPEKGQLQKGVLIQNLGQPTAESEVAILLANYAYDCQKELRPYKSKQTKEGAFLVPSTKRTVLEGFTFNIDPPGCRDVDDSFTLKQVGQDAWQVSINIADVASLIEEGSDLDVQARKRSTSFYSPTGECLAPMFPPELVEAASLGADDPRPALSLQFVYCYENGISDFKWAETTVIRSRSFTYDEADALLHNWQELKVIRDITRGANSHEWVQQLMILYNQKAGEALKARGLGILRSHSAPKAEELAQLTAIDPSFGILAYEAATFCLPSDESKHFGLDTDAYAYASSPIRRYCDLVNQRCLKGLASAYDKDLINHLNRRQKQAKAFSRDFFFMTQLSNSKDVEGTVIGQAKDKSKCKVYVPVWKRTIKVRLLDTVPPQGTKVSIEWYDDREKPNWKERIVFKIR